MGNEPEKSNDTLKLLQNARQSLGVTFAQKKQEHSDHLALADKARDAMLRTEGAIQQIDLFISQLEKGKK